MSSAICSHCKQRVPLRQDKTLVPHKRKSGPNAGDYNFKTRTSGCPGSDTKNHNGEQE